MRTALFSIFVVIAAITLGYAEDNRNQQENLDIVSRTIRIEGSPEKPRVIFIVPKAKVWDNSVARRSFLKELLEPASPEMSNISRLKP